jgi:hypothetical protein
MQTVYTKNFEINTCELGSLLVCIQRQHYKCRLLLLLVWNHEVLALLKLEY